MNESPILLVPIDGSALAKRALPLAIEIAEGVGGRIHLVAVLDDSLRKPMEEFATGEGISLSEALTAMLRRTVREASEGTEVPVDADYAIHDNAAEAILSSARETGASMIVLASHGRSGPSRWLLGSVAHKVLEAAPVPVLLVPARQAAQEAAD